MSKKEALLKKLTDDEHTKDLKRYYDSLYMIRALCGVTLAQSAKYDDATFFDMGRGTVEAMTDDECNIMYDMFIKKNIIINGLCNELMSNGCGVK